jgi:solute carrier family 25 phosphate transporter 3
MFKYGLYEIFKDIYGRVAGQSAQEYKVLGYALSSASAELFADLFLCPWESVKVRMQTQVFTKFPGKLVPAMK